MSWSCILANTPHSAKTRSGVSCTVESDGADSLPPQLETVLYRVTQESLADEQEFYLKQGYITTRLDPASMIDPSFGEEAVRILGRADE